MNRKIIYLGIVLLLWSVCSIAQQKSTCIGKVKITPYELKQRGDSLYIHMKIEMDGGTVESNKSLDIIPVLTNGAQMKDLPSVSVKGKQKYKEYRRFLSLMSKKQKEQYVAPYATLKGYDINSALSYKYVVPFEEWMSKAWLDAKSDLCGCGSKTRQIVMERLVNNVSLEKKIIIEPYQIIPHSAYLEPKMEEVIKHRQKNVEVNLDFPVNKTVINPDYMNNPEELAKIRRMIDELKEDKHIRVTKLQIIGYASPEGTLAINKCLSEGRANALRDYLSTHYDFPQSLYTIEFGGENWVGLVKALAHYEIPEKEQILNIIHDTPIEKGREAKIMRISRGTPYKEMLRNIFPKLRTAICKVDYDVKNFNAEEAKEVIRTRPQNLSLVEMYAVAKSYEMGSDEFNDTFETAARMFPEDDIAGLNAALASLARKDVTSAERYLSRVKGSKQIPEYINAKGMLEMLKGNYDKAEEYLKQAAEAGLKAAEQNLEEISKKKENIELIKLK